MKFSLRPRLRESKHQKIDRPTRITPAPQKSASAIAVTQRAPSARRRRAARLVQGKTNFAAVHGRERQGFRGARVGIQALTRGKHLPCRRRGFGCRN